MFFLNNKLFRLLWIYAFYDVGFYRTDGLKQKFVTDLFLLDCFNYWQYFYLCGNFTTFKRVNILHNSIWQ